MMNIEPTDLKEYLKMCPYDDCTGDAVIDAKEYDSIRSWHKYSPNYPEIPKYGIVYPLN